MSTSFLVMSGRRSVSKYGVFLVAWLGLEKAKGHEKECCAIRCFGPMPSLRKPVTIQQTSHRGGLEILSGKLFCVRNNQQRPRAVSSGPETGSEATGEVPPLGPINPIRAFHCRLQL